MTSTRELAYRYDLYIVPHWREPFDQMIMDHMDIPSRGDILVANCGTGGLAMELASRVRQEGVVIGIDSHRERLPLAREKASLKHLENLSFLDTTPAELLLEEVAFDLIVADATLIEPEGIESLASDMAHLTHENARLAIVLLTFGSFGEVFSLLWEALYRCDLAEEAQRVEEFMNAYPTCSQAEELMQRLGLNHVHSFTERLGLRFASAKEFLESPLIEDYFLGYWTEFLGQATERSQVITVMAEIIDREHQPSHFEISVKGSLLVGQK